MFADLMRAQPRHSFDAELTVPVGASRTGMRRQTKLTDKHPTARPGGESGRLEHNPHHADAHLHPHRKRQERTRQRSGAQWRGGLFDGPSLWPTG